MHTSTKPAYSLGEEIANSVSHGLGVAAAIVGLTLMLTKGIPVLKGPEIAGIAIYGASLVALFLASTLYHAIPHARTKDILKRVDHGAIYLLIAGTYTPFLSISIKTPTADNLLLGLWVMAAVGVIFKIFFVHSLKWMSLVTYLAMGWAGAFLLSDLQAVLPETGFALLVAGGLCYTLGAVFYAMKKVRYTHAIWHLWVVGGAACHCVAVAGYVIP